MIGDWLQLGRLTDGFLPCDEDMMSQILDLCVSSVDESFFSGDEDDVDMFADGGRDDVAQAVLQQVTMATVTLDNRVLCCCKVFLC